MQGESQIERGCHLSMIRGVGRHHNRDSRIQLLILKSLLEPAVPIGLTHQLDQLRTVCPLQGEGSAKASTPELEANVRWRLLCQRWIPWRLSFR